jgi:hypothetical protein
MAYNGWTNRETWLINNWFYPESNKDVYRIREIVEQDIEMLPPYLKDFISIYAINWEELHSHFEEENNHE